MNVIARQGIKYTIIGYMGFLIGAISNYFIFPFDFKFYGKLRFVLNTAEIVVPLVIFGLSYANVKFFLSSQQVGRHHNLLSWSIIGILLNFLVFCVIFFGIHYLFPSLQTNNYWDLKWIIIPLILVLALSHLFNRYITNYKRIAVSNIFENIFPKLANVGAFSLFIFLGIAQQWALLFFFGVFVCVLMAYLFYVNRLEPIKLDFRTDYLGKNQLGKAFLLYSFFGFLGNIGNHIAIRIDQYMIGEFLNFESLGIYSTLFGIISLVSIPQLGLFSISAPIINQLLEEKKYKELKEMHQKTSLYLFFLGAIFLSCIVVGFPFLVEFIKNGNLLAASEPVIWILGFGLLIDLGTGFNGNIISLSQYYRWNIYFMLLLSTLTVFLNMVFLKFTNMGLVGVALATFIALLVYNTFKIIFNYIKFGVHPFSKNMFFIFLVSAISVTIVYFLPVFDFQWVNLLYKPLVVLIFFFSGNYLLNIIPLQDFFKKSFFKNLIQF